jgi:hypothetical protein
LGFSEDFASPIFGVHLKVTHEKKPPRNCSKISISLLRIKRLKNANVNRFKIAKSVSKSLKIYFRKKITQEYFNMSFCNLMRSFEKKQFSIKEMERKMIVSIDEIVWGLIHLIKEN